MPLIDTEVNFLIDQESARTGFASLHTTNPGTSGTGEVSGGSPAYARKAVAWPPSSGKSSTGPQVTFDVPAGTYGYFGLWSAATGGTFRGGNPLGSPETFAGQGQLKVTVTLAGNAT